MIVLLLLIPILAGLASACEEGWEKHCDFCFMFSHNKVTWAEAVALCDALNGYLAEPSSKTVDDVVSKKSLDNGAMYWLGGSDIEKEGSFTWLTSNMPFTYTNWIPGDPNNAHSGEDCLMNNHDGHGKWVDADCERHEYYVCQKEDDGDVHVVG